MQFRHRCGTTHSKQRWLAHRATGRVHLRLMGTISLVRPQAIPSLFYALTRGSSARQRRLSAARFVTCPNPSRPLARAQLKHSAQVNRTTLPHHSHHQVSRAHRSSTLLPQLSVPPPTAATTLHPRRTTARAYPTSRRPHRHSNHSSRSRSPHHQPAMWAGTRATRSHHFRRVCR